MNNINLKEDKVHGDFFLPFTTYFCEFLNNTGTCVTHWHEEIEILLIESGTGEFKVDLDSYILEEGDILIIKPFSLHSMHPLRDTYCSWNSMLFSLNMLNSSITDGCLIKYFAPLWNNEHQLPLVIKSDFKGYNEIYDSIKKIFTCFNGKSIAYELKLKSLLFNFFSLLYENHLITKKKVASISNETTRKIKIILNYIEENYGNEIPICDIANICNLSQYYFMKFFKKNIGMTFTEYVNFYRLDIASKLLNSTDKSITEISFETGFNSVSYFNKLFKNQFKVTPKEFRSSNSI